MVGAERRASFAASMLGSPADSLVMLILPYIRMASVRFGFTEPNPKRFRFGSETVRFQFEPVRFHGTEPKPLSGRFVNGSVIPTILIPTIPTIYHVYDIIY